MFCSMSLQSPRTVGWRAAAMRSHAAVSSYPVPLICKPRSLREAPAVLILTCWLVAGGKRAVYLVQELHGSVTVGLTLQRLTGSVG